MANAFERLIGTLSPGWALNRARARAAWNVVQRLELGYDAADTGRRAARWVATSGSANAEITPALSRVRNRSRDMVRNNPYARSAITKLVARAVGTGIMARWESKQTREVWNEFVEVADYEGQHDLYGQMSLMARTIFESGEVLVQRVRGKSRDLPLQIHVLEPDYLDDLKFGWNGENFVIAGIEIDRTGRRQAYWIYDHHPGEVGQLPKTFKSKRVEASEILHVYEKERPGQLRGMPRLAASMMRLREVDEYQDAQMMRKKIEACFVGFVRGAGTSAPLAHAGDVATTAGQRIETFRPGMIIYGQPGEEIEFGSPSGVARDEYTNDQLHAIAAGAGVTYEQLTGDFSQVTYLSARAAQIELRSLVEMFQWIQFIPMGCRGIARWFLDAYYDAGRLRTANYRAGWTAPRWHWVDPAKDVAAAKDEVRGGFVPLEEKQREMGLDPDETTEAFAREREKHREKKLVFDTDAGAVPKGAAAAPAKPATEDEGGAKPKARAADASED